MSSLCLYFQVHQPRRLKRYRFFDIGNDHEYFNDSAERDTNNARVLRKVADKCYLPANQTMLELLHRHPEYKFSFSISGIALEQFAEYAPEVLESFQRLVDTGRVEILSETYYHSLSFLRSKAEFRDQVALHRQTVEHLLGVTPEVFRNTELIYRNDIADEVSRMGYKGMLAEGADRVLGWRSPNFVYHAVGNPEFKVLTKNYQLSDDIAFRFGNRGWEGWPLTAGKFAHWVSSHNGNGEIINLFMDYESFGEHQWEDTGIFDFLRHMPEEVLRHPDNDFVTPSEAVDRYSAVGEYDAPDYVSWADVERDISAWLDNPIQHDALQAIFSLEDSVRATGDTQLLQDWRRLTTSDHFYYMCTKWFNDGDVHAYFNPYDSPYEAYIAYMNVLRDMELRIAAATPKNKRSLMRTKWRDAVRNLLSPLLGKKVTV
jgi:alpha-amylase